MAVTPDGPDVSAASGSADAAAIGEACRATGVAPTPQQIDALTRYLDLLQRWNATYNLSALRDRKAMLSHHIADCLAVVPPLRRQAGDACRVLDVGSGGGLPGVVIAVMLPDSDVTCVDAVGKKAAFVRQAAGALQLPNLGSIHGRVEEIRLPLFDVIVSRAFAPLADFTTLTAHLLAPAGQWIAMKGRVPDNEIAALAQSENSSAAVFHVEHLSVPGLSAERCLVWMQHRDTVIAT